MRQLHSALSLLPLLILVTGCTVYAPLQPRLPEIRERGQGMLNASLQLGTGRPELAAAYSPLRYVLLSATGSWRPSSADTTEFQARLGELGLGGYLPLPNGWTLSGLAGGGGGQTARTIGLHGLLDRYTCDYVARYQTRFAQLGALHRYTPHRSLGFGYRLTQLRFEELRTARYELAPENQLRHELFAVLRHDLGPGRWQLELSGALSLSQPRYDRHVLPTDPIPYHVNLNRGSTLLLGVGVVYRVGKKQEGE